MDEEWKSFENIEVSSLGRVKTERIGIHFGSGNSNGYRQVAVKCKMVQVHRLVAHLWLGLDLDDKKRQVNHVNCDRADNRVDNLELVSNRENQQRTKHHLAGRLVGTCFNKSTGKWQASIKINYKQKYLGIFETEQDAHEAYTAALSLNGILEEAK